MRGLDSYPTLKGVRTPYMADKRTETWLTLLSAGAGGDRSVYGVAGGYRGG
jgi:hypothetical protein